MHGGQECRLQSRVQSLILLCDAGKLLNYAVPSVSQRPAPHAQEGELSELIYVRDPVHLMPVRQKTRKKCFLVPSALILKIVINVLCVCVCVCVCLIPQLCPTLCDPMDCGPPGPSVHGDSPGKNTAVGCHALLQGIFTPPGLPHCRQILYHLSHQGSPSSSQIHEPV